MAGAAVGGAILLPYGCSQSEVGVSASPLSTDYTFYKIFDLSSGLFDDLKSITPGVMINDANQILFYGDRGDDQYALYELAIDYASAGPRIESSRVAVATGQSVGGDRPVQRILRADTNPKGDLALLLDFFDGSDRPPAADELETVFVQSDSRFERIVGFGDAAPGDGRFGGAFGDLAINNDTDLMLVSYHTTAEDEIRHGVFSMEQASLSSARLMLDSGGALQGSANAIVRGYGLIDMYGDDNAVAQTQIAPPLSATTGQPPGSTGGLLQVSTGVGRLAIQPRVLSAPQVFGLSTSAPAEIILGARASNEGRAAWVGHSADGEEMSLYFRSDTQAATEVARTTADGPIFSLSPPVLSANGLLTYLQINNDEDNPFEVKAVGSGAPVTILSLQSEIDGEKPTTLMHGYHSRQADSEGRIVVYAEFGEGIPAILLGIPS